MTRGPTALITGRGSKFVVESSSSSVWCGFRAFASQSHCAGNALSAPSAVIRFILKAINVSSPSTEIYWKKCKKSVRRRCWFSLLLSRTRGETVMSLMVFKYKILRNIQFLLQLNGIVSLVIKARESSALENWRITCIRTATEVERVCNMSGAIVVNKIGNSNCHRCLKWNL